MKTAYITVSGRMWLDIDDSQYESESELNQAIADLALLNLEQLQNFKVDTIEWD